MKLNLKVKLDTTETRCFDCSKSIILRSPWISKHHSHSCHCKQEQDSSSSKNYIFKKDIFTFLFLWYSTLLIENFKNGFDSVEEEKETVIFPELWWYKDIGTIGNSFCHYIALCK